jgi:hypothetical protein
MIRLFVWMISLIPLLGIAQQDVYLNVRNNRRPVQIKFQRGAEITIKIDKERLK